MMSANPVLNDQEYNQGKTILRSTPKTIFIQASGPCNSSCVFCSRGKEYEMFNLAKHRERFENNLYPFISKAQTLALTGSGEFLQLPDAEDILDFFDNTFPATGKFFATNGSSLSSAICDNLIGSKSNYTIHVSLHASKPQLHRVITRMDNFDKIIEQVRRLIKLRGNNNRLRINLIFVATTLNIEDLPDFIRLAKDLNANKVVCYYNYIYIPAQKYLSCFFKQELTNRMLDEAGVLAGKLNIGISLPFSFGRKVYPKLDICREPFSQIMFNSSGHVLACDAAEDCDEVLSEEKNFMDIWNGPYYQKLRKSLSEGSCSCVRHCLRANPASINNFDAHVIHRGKKAGEEIGILWGDNF